jgi:hypothetical protein
MTVTVQRRTELSYVRAEFLYAIEIKFSGHKTSLNTLKRTQSTQKCSLITIMKLEMSNEVKVVEFST